jgi:two-component system nitrate/nitrite response regulator NarL
MIRVLVADRHELMRRAVLAVLQREPDIEVVGEATDRTELLALAAEMKPDVVVLDSEVPPVSGAAALRELRRLSYGGAILIISFWSDQERIRECLELGADGYIHKERLTDVLVTGVRALASGGFYIGPRIREILGEELYSYFTGRPAPVRRQLWNDGMTIGAN